MSVIQMSSRGPAVELRDVRKSFGKTEIIRGASLTVAQGERVAIIGPNGAGKSTLFNLISGRFAPTSGEIHLAFDFFSSDVLDSTYKQKSHHLIPLPRPPTSTNCFSKGGGLGPKGLARRRG